MSVEAQVYIRPRWRRTDRTGQAVNVEGASDVLLVIPEEPHPRFDPYWRCLCGEPIAWSDYGEMRFLGTCEKCFADVVVRALYPTMFECDPGRDAILPRYVYRLDWNCYQAVAHIPHPMDSSSPGPFDPYLVGPDDGGVLNRRRNWPKVPRLSSL